MKVHDMDKIDLLMHLHDKYSVQKKVYYSKYSCLSFYHAHGNLHMNFIKKGTWDGKRKE